MQIMLADLPEDRQTETEKKRWDVHVLTAPPPPTRLGQDIRLPNTAQVFGMCPDDHTGSDLTYHGIVPQGLL